MYFELVAETDTGSVVVFDPAALASLGGLGYDDVIRDLRAGPVGEAIGGGGLLLYHTAADGSYKLGFHLDEPPPDGERVRAHVAGVLRVPSGRLQAGGLEHLPFDGRRYEPTDEQQIPPGTYRLDVYQLEVDEDDAEPELPYSRVGAVMVATCIALFLAAVLLVAAGHWRWAIAAAVAIPVLFVGFRALYRRAGGPALEREQRRREPPSLRVVLARVDDAAAAGLRGVSLGE
jgi:hypothetical protein